MIACLSVACPILSRIQVPGVSSHFFVFVAACMALHERWVDEKDPAWRHHRGLVESTKNIFRRKPRGDGRVCWNSTDSWR